MTGQLSACRSAASCSLLVVAGHGPAVPRASGRPRGADTGVLRFWYDRTSAGCTLSGVTALHPPDTLKYPPIYVLNAL